MADSDVPDDVEAGTTELLEEAEAIDRDSPAASMHAENQLVSKAVDYVAAWSEQGSISSSDANALADALSGEFAHYNKTDIKSEFTEVFVDEADTDGIPFDELIENRLEEVKIVTTTDAKKGVVWRWHFADGVQLETETSKDGGRKHFEWPSWKEDYFEALLSLGQGERIAPPTRGRRDSAKWKAWLSDLMLEQADTFEHVGPRTEAVELLKDHINRQTAFKDLKDMRDRQGISMDAPPADSDTETATDGGGPSELRVPTQTIKRICDQAGIETRGLQVELDARGHTVPDIAGVSDYDYVEGKRISYWCLDPNIADPGDFIEDPDSPAEQAAEEQRARAEETRTDVGAVEDEDQTGVGDDGDHDDEDNTDADADDEDDEDTQGSDVEDDGDRQDETPLDDDDDAPPPPPDEPIHDEDDHADDHETGITDGFGVDPDAAEDGGE